MSALFGVGTMREIDIDQTASAVAEKAAVLDVREPAEYRDGHIPGAVNIPMSQLRPGWASSTAMSPSTSCARRATAAAP